VKTRNQTTPLDLAGTTPRWRSSFAAMRTVDRARTGRRRRPGRCHQAGALTAVGACALGASGCGEGCQAHDPGRERAFQTAWHGDSETMRRLIAEARVLPMRGSAHRTTRQSAG
jgi:hypothetical protein